MLNKVQHHWKAEIKILRGRINKSTNDIEKARLKKVVEYMRKVDMAVVITVGLVNKTQVHPREVFADPLTDRATAIIVAHNHPTGTLTPSKDDIANTRQLKSAGETLGIKLIDHIIFSHKGYYSFRENNMLE